MTRKLGPAEPLRWPVLLAIAAAMIIWCAVDVQRRGRVDPERLERHRTDFTVYTEAGAAFFDGRDPYAVTNPRGWLYLYLPMFAIVVSPLHALPPQWQVTVWFLLCCAFGWGSVRELTRIARTFAGPSADPLWNHRAAQSAVAPGSRRQRFRNLRSGRPSPWLSCRR